jgi:hypothetical protein
LKKGKMKGIWCSQSNNSFPMKVSDWAIGRHAVMCFPKFRGWLWRRLNNSMWPYSVPQKRRLSGFYSVNISSNNDKLWCIIMIQELLKNKLVKEWECFCILLEAL